MAQLVEHNLAKVGVAGSNPVVRSRQHCRPVGRPAPLGTTSVAGVSVSEPRGDLLWTPPIDVMETTPIGRFVGRLRADGHSIDTYEDLWRWSVTDLDGFWSAVRAHFDLGRGGTGRALGAGTMPGAEWFPGSTWNYAAEALRHEVSGPAVVAWSQTREPITLSMAELRNQVARCRHGLRRLGVQAGDRVAGYLPNIPEALVAFLAVASIGAIWTAAPPEFGVRAVIDRFAQVEPVVLVAVQGYRYGARSIDRAAHLAQLRQGLPSVRHTVVVPYLDIGGPPAGAVAWAELLAGDDGGVDPADDHEQVPFDHPLYVLYSSGTTGLPKAIVHGHGGIICEHVKALALHHDLGAGDRFFWFSTTGWMMWNFLVSGLLVGASIVCFDGDPGAPDLGTLWRLAAETGVSVLGLSAPFIDACRRADLRPAVDHDLAALRAIGVTGAPLSAAGAAWVCSVTRPDVHLTSISGGTDVCTAFVGGCAMVPVRAGEISCRWLGARVEAWTGDGQPVVGIRGELVVTAPMPSMPVGFWGDPDGRRYRDAYFEAHPGVWTHGDWITVYADGACTISGRTDATLNRGGVRLGSAEIYAVVDEIDGVEDSLIVHLEEGDGPGELVLFVRPTDGADMDDDRQAAIRTALRTALSPRHAPDRIVAVRAVPRTLSGKRLEVPVKRILRGAPPDQAVSRDSLADPDSLDDLIVAARRAGMSRPGAS